MPELRFEADQNVVASFTVFKDIMENMFIKLTLSHLPEYVMIERLSLDQIIKLNGG